MKHLIIFATALLLLGAGCAPAKNGTSSYPGKEPYVAPTSPPPSAPPPSTDPPVYSY